MPDFKTWTSEKEKVEQFFDLEKKLYDLYHLVDEAVLRGDVNQALDLQTKIFKAEQELREFNA